MAMSVGKKGKRKTMAEINITPFTDVCLVLLIIFMVSTSFISAQRGLDIKLPSPSSASKNENPPRDITLAIQRDGTIQMTVTNGNAPAETKALQPAQLEPELERTAHAYKIQSVTIKATHGVIYRSVVGVMDAVKVAGIDTMALAVEAPAGGAGTGNQAGAPQGSANTTPPATGGTRA